MELRPTKEATQRLGLLGILPHHGALKPGELITIDRLHCASAARGSERQDVIQIRIPDERMAEAYGFARRAKIYKRPEPHIPAVGSGSRDADYLLAVGFIAEKHVPAFNLLAQVAEA